MTRDSTQAADELWRATGPSSLLLAYLSAAGRSIGLLKTASTSSPAPSLILQLLLHDSTTATTRGFDRPSDVGLPDSAQAFLSVAETALD